MSWFEEFGGYIVSAVEIIAGAILTASGAGTPLGIPLIIAGVSSAGLALLAPRVPSGAGGLQNSPTYGFDQATNAAFEGMPRRSIWGELELAPSYVSVFTEQVGAKQYLSALLYVCQGGEYGIEDVTDLQINDQPEGNFKDIEWQWDWVDSSSVTIDGFNRQSTPWSDGSLLQKGTDWVYTTHRAVSEVDLVLAWLGGLRYVDKGGSEKPTYWVASVYYKDEGDDDWTRYPVPKAFADDKSDAWWDGGSIHGKGNWGITGQSRSVFRAVLPLTFETAKVRTIKVAVTTASDDHGQRDATMVRVEEVTYGDLTVDGAVLMSIRFLAQEQLSGGLPRITCIVKGRKVKALGDVTAAWTRNPAKIIFDYLTDADDFTGDWISESDIDDGSGGTWRTVSARCDATVSMEQSGAGTLPPEAHWQLDYVVDTKASAAEHLAAMLAAFRAQIIEYEGKIRLVQDVAGSSVATFDSRILGDTTHRPILSTAQQDDMPGVPDIREEEIPPEDRPTHVRLQFMDREDRYSRVWTEEVVASSWSDGDPTVRHEGFLIGVTRESQALREARAIVLRADLRPVVVEFGAGIGDLDILPMDVITLYADYPTWDGKLFQVLSRTYDFAGRGRVQALEYDADAYDDTSDKLPSRPAWSTRQDALKRARQIPRGASNVKIKEIKGSYHLQVSWDASPDTALRLWRVYLSTRKNVKGELQAEVQATGRAYIIRDVTEAEYWIRILAVSMTGTEEDYRDSQASAHYFATRIDTAVSDLTNAGGGKVDNSQATKVVADPPPSTDPVSKVEVIKGASADTGQLVGTVAVEREGITGDQGERQVSVAITSQPGRRTGGGTETLNIRAVDPEGKRGGASTQVTVPHLDLPNFHAVEIASIVGSTLTGISSPSGTDPWTVHATDGARLRAVPAISSLDPDWGTVGSGLFASLPVGAFYCTEATLTFDEYDFGATFPFSLECYDEAQRKSAAGAWSQIDVRRLKHWPLFPGGEPDRRANHLGPEWLMRMVTIEGKPMRPLPPTTWEFRAGTSSPLSGDWMPYVPGMQLYARYVQARVTLKDPLGLHQVISPRIYVRAWVANDTRVVVKAGADFDASEIGDMSLPAGVREIGVRTDAGNESIQINIGGTIKYVALT